ncbi:MAG: tetratricopeptide repeat protein, partial [Steroidobacteraceae bacterium]
MGISYLYEGHIALARESYAAALKEFDQLKETRGAIMVRQNLAAADFEAGDFGSALRAYEQLEPIARRSSDDAQLMDIAANTAVIYSVTDQPDKALAGYAAALAMQERASDMQGVARSNHGIAGVYMRMGRADRALTYYREALRIRGEIEDGRGLVATLTAMGDAARELGAFKDSERAHGEALTLAKSDRELARAHLSVALDCLAAGRVDCRRRGIEAVLQSSLPPEHPLRARALEESTLLQQGAAATEQVLKSLAHVEATYAALGSPGDVARVDYRAAVVARDAGLVDEALSLVGKSIGELEAVRGRIATPEVRARLLEDANAPYDLRADLL